MKKFICTVCGYVHEGDEAPEICLHLCRSAHRTSPPDGPAVPVSD